MTKKSVGMNYHGSLFWLIFWMILFFPIGLALLFTSFSYNSDNQTHTVVYQGSRFWLCFWLLLFFPIGLLLLVLNGFVITIEPANEDKPQIKTVNS